MDSSRYEREFSVYANSRGFHAERVAGSGRAKHSVCDVVLIKDGQVYLTEVKSTRDTVYYVSDKPQVQDRLEVLMEAARRCGATPFLAVRFKRRGRQARWAVKKLTPKLRRVKVTDKSLL